MSGANTLSATPLSRILARALRGPIVSVASQGVGMVQILLLLLRAGANEATDAYYYLFNLGLVPITGIVVGVVYPSMLNDERMSRLDLKRLRTAVPILCALMVAGGSGWLEINGRLPRDLVPLAALSCANAVIQARLWFRAVAAEAGGQAMWIAGVALPPNVVAVAVLLPPWSSPTGAVTGMVAGLVLGNLGLLAVMNRRRVGDDVILAAPLTGGSRRGTGWYFGSAVFAFASWTILQSLAVLLPAASLTIINLAYKVVGSISATFVNATMPLLVHSRTESPALARRFLRVVAVSAILGGTALVIGTWLRRPDLVVPAFVVGIWLVGSGSNAVAQRMAFRFLRPRQSSRPQMMVIAAVVGAALASAHSPAFSVTVLLCAYATIDGTAATTLLWPLKDRKMSAILALAVAALAVLWLSTVLGLWT